MADIIIGLILLAVALLALRSVLGRGRKGCSGDCSCCGGSCCHKRNKDSENNNKTPHEH